MVVAVREQDAYLRFCMQPDVLLMRLFFGITRAVKAGPGPEPGVDSDSHAIRHTCAIG